MPASVPLPRHNVSLPEGVVAMEPVLAPSVITVADALPRSNERLLAFPVVKSSLPDPGATVMPPVNTRLLSGYQDFGGSSSVRSQNGCTLVITNVTGSFAAGQSFTFFQYYGGGNPSSTGTSTNTYPVISPSEPGSGLKWDLTQLWPSGVIGVVNANSGPTLTNSFTVVGGTNIIGQFDWSSSYLGYRLQSLVTDARSARFGRAKRPARPSPAPAQTHPH